METRYLFLDDRGMKLTIEELEYYDEKEVIRPVVRLHRQKINEKWPKYATIETSSFAMKDYYDHGLVDLPKTGDFNPWKDYEDGRENAIEQFYHQFQFVPLRHLILLNNISLRPKFLEVTDVEKAFENIKK